MEEEDQELKHVCKFCNKSFPCGRSLGGHMRSHNNSVETTTAADDTTNYIETGGYSLRENPKKTIRLADSSLVDNTCSLYNTTSLEDDQDYHTLTTNITTTTQSDDNETAAPNRKRRSKRKTRYINSGSFFSLAAANNNNNNASSSVSETEQEEVAICLMMLSKDVGFNSVVGESCHDNDNNNNSGFLESKIDEILKSKSLSKKKMDCVSRRISIKEIVKNDRVMDFNEYNSSKRKVSYDPVFGSDSLKKSILIDDADFFKDSSKKRNRFECTTCNRIFQSYQALGGHRASHKKMKGCFASRIDSSENSVENDQIEPTIAADQIDHHHHHHLLDDNNHHQTIKKKHECPICFKVFSSGQALGGHKRSHLLGEASRNNKTIGMEKPEIRKFLDLNLPAPVEEDSMNGHLGFRPWWINNNHKHVGLISN